MQARYLILTLFLLAISSWAAGQDHGEAVLFDQVSSLRLEIERFDDTRTDVIKQRDLLAGRLDSLAARIKKHKADLPDGSLLPDFALQNMLRKSQEMSESLTLINKELEALRSVRTERLQRLGQFYGQLVDQTAKRIRTASGTRQIELVKVLSRVRHERDLVRRELGSGPAPTLPMETQNLLASDDPEELSERADAVSDEQDRLRRRLASLDQSITEIRADRRLEREMRDFVEDHTLFGEESRILQVSKPAPGTNNHADSNPEEGGRQNYIDEAQLGGNEADPSDGAFEGGFPGAGESTGILDQTADIETREGQVPVNVGVSDSDFNQMNPAKKLQLLKRRRWQVVDQIKKLQILHDRLREKTESLIND